jgi:uncharacterized protein (DUF2267 family)
MAELKFVESVAERARVPVELAGPLTEATIRTLAERISGGEAADLADRVPDQYRPLLIKREEAPERFTADDFIHRVAERAGVAQEVAQRGIQAVLATMHSVVGHKELSDALAQLPKELQRLAQPAPHTG